MAGTCAGPGHGENMIQAVRPSKIRSLLTGQAAYCAALTAIVFLGLAVRINVASKHCVPYGDEGAWLRCAVQVGRADFMTSRVIEHDLYPVRKLPHPEDNRSPLYPVLIDATRLAVHDAFRAGESLNLAASLLLILALAVSMRRAFGKAAAIGACGFYAASPFLITLSAEIYPDLLVALGFYLF
jgi:hypothetical protein